MKNRLLQSHLSLLLLLAITSFTAQAQWVTSGSNVYTTGKVGIGMSSAPTYNLDINGAGATATINLLSGSASASSQLVLGRTATDSKIGIAYTNNNLSMDAIAGDFVIRTEGAGRKILFNTNGGTAGSTVAISGNTVGIGTSTPSAYLDIPDNTVPGAHFIEVGNDAYLTDLDLPNVLGVYGLTDNTQGGIKLGSSNPLIYGYNGKIGVGTTTPTATLEVSGTLKISGASIFARIDASEYHSCVTPGTCPDYVFSSSYQLMSINDLEKYINTNKHLPDVKSASEMESTGMDITAMNLLLLRKVEELTIYIVNQQKDIHLQQKKIEALEAIIKK